MEHIGPQVTQDTTRIVVSEQPLLYRVYVRSVGVYSGIMCGCVRYVLRVARVDSGWGVQILFLLHLDLVSSSCRCTAVMAPNYVVMYATVWVLSRICHPQEEPLSAGRVRVHTCCECYNKRGYIRTWYVYKIFFLIFRLMKYRRLLFFTLGRSVSA